MPDPPEPTCPLCGEPVRVFEKCSRAFVHPVHWECGLRSVIGGVNHLRGRCTCCGGTDDPDPPGMTRRQAAQAAAVEYYLRNPDF